MISNHLPSIDSSLFRPFRTDQDADNRPAGATESSTTDSLSPRSHRRVEPGQGVDTFMHNAKHMVKDALKDFRHGIKDTIKDLGFDKGMIGKITKAVIKPIAEAVRSGTSFSASLMFAAVSTTQSAAGSAFSFAARNIEIEVNFETGTVDITSIDLAIEGETLTTGARPHLLDVTDSATEIPQMPDLFGQIRQIISDLLGSDEGDDAPEEIALDDSAVPEVTPEASDPATDPVPVPEELEQAIENLPDYRGSVRISVMAYEYFRNESEQQMLRLRLNATVPLTPPANTEEPSEPSVLPAA